MDGVSFLIHLLNGLQQGLLLFLVAGGLTLIFGVMGVINLAHGALYMVGAYLAYALTSRFDNLLLILLCGAAAMALIGLVIERFLVAAIYRRPHLDQVLLTYGLILLLDESRSLLWGNDVHGVAIPAAFAGSIPLTDSLDYPLYRIAVMAFCLAVALGLWLAIHKTRLGMRIRAGADNREMAQALGIDIRALFALLFAAGAALAGLAGMVAAPLTSVAPGMDNAILLISFVVVVIGGVGSVKGAFWGALLVGLADVFGAVLLPQVSGALVYLTMTGVLLWRPQGLFATR